MGIFVANGITQFFSITLLNDLSTKKVHIYAMVQSYIIGGAPEDSQFL